jgi:hypothetical protein
MLEFERHGLVCGDPAEPTIHGDPHLRLYFLSGKGAACSGWFPLGSAPFPASSNFKLQSGTWFSVFVFEFTSGEGR